MLHDTHRGLRPNRANVKNNSETCNSKTHLPYSEKITKTFYDHMFIVHSSNFVPTHFSKLDPENWIFSSNFFILNNYEQLPILLLQFYNYCNYISLLNLRKENFSSKLVVRNKSSL